MAENSKTEFDIWKWGVSFRLPFIGAAILFWMGTRIWGFSAGRSDYGTVVIAVPGVWFAWSDPGLNAWGERTNWGRTEARHG